MLWKMTKELPRDGKAVFFPDLLIPDPQVDEASI